MGRVAVCELSTEREQTPMKRGLVVFLCLSGATGTLACVNLETPAAVAECTKAGTCSHPVDAPVVWQPDVGGAESLDLGSPSSDGVVDRTGSPSDATDAPADHPNVPVDGGNLDVVVGACWTAKGPVPTGTVCRPAVGLCDVAEVCDGINATCPADKFALGDTVCREAVGDCDIAESCTGASPECPDDVLRSAGAICRVSAGPCDVAESCSGTEPECPVDGMAPAQTVCNESTDGNLCDPAEKCTGSDVACPEDAIYTKPGVPASVTATAGVLKATISWTTVPGATGYNVQRSDTSKSGYTIQGSAPTVKESPYVNTGLTGGATYYYIVTALNTIATCESDLSAEVLAKPDGECTPPPVPTVTATPTNGQIVLTWTASAGATSYMVARSATAGTGYASIAVVSTGISYTDLNVSNGTTYYYVVRASNGKCSSVDSAEVYSSPICTPPAPPTNLVATPSDGSVALSWTAPTGAVSYRILRSTVAGSGYTLAGNSATTSYTDATVTNGTTYYYVVTASNGTCSSVNSPEAPASPACVPPSVPASVTATPGNMQVVLAWTPSSGGAVSYEVSRSTTTGGPYTSVGKPTSAGYTDTKLVNGTAYYYVVTASNGKCSSASSVQVSAVPLCTPPTLPTAVKATPGDSKVALSWTASTNGPTSYTVSRAEGTGAYTILGTPTTTSFTDSTAVNGHTYSYVVSASNGTCSSDNTTAVTATPAAVCAQVAPTGLTATSVSQKVTINWTAAAGAVDYDISRSATAGAGYAAVGTVTAPTTTFVDTDTKLQIGTTYYYVVTANNEACSSPNSAEVSATVVCTPPTVPSGLTTSPNTTDGSVTVSWATVADATGYTVSRSTSASGTYTDISSNQTAATYKDTGCASGTTCYYKVRSTNVGGTCVSVDSAAVSGAACKMPGVPTGLTKSVGVPTPGAGKVTLNWTGSSNADSYEILRSTTQGSGYASFSNNTTTTTSFTDSGLNNDSSYYYVVKARNGGAACTSANSAEIKAIPRACRVLPGSTSSVTLDTGATCFVTCWDIAAGTWNCSNFEPSSRNMTINGRSTSPCGTDPGAKSSSGSYTFNFTAGVHNYDEVKWWSNGTTQAHDCP
jgi:fibronectin type 3 domain-containing protein